MKPNQTHDPHGIFLMLLSVFLFSANTLLIRAVSLRYPAVDGWTATLLRGIVGMVIVIALYGGGRGLSLKKLLCGKLIIIRGIAGALSTVAFYLTISSLGPSRAVVLNLTYPIFATIMAAVWLKEKVPARSIFWMAGGFAGLVLFLGGNLDRGISGWDLVALAGAIGSGLVIVLIRKLRETETSGTIYGSQCLYTIVLTLPMSGSTVVETPVIVIVLLSAAAIIVSIAQLVMTNAYRTLPVSKGSSIQMLLPVATAAGAWLCFDETFTLPEIAGAILTLFATWRVAVPRRG